MAERGRFLEEAAKRAKDLEAQKETSPESYAETVAKAVSTSVGRVVTSKPSEKEKPPIKAEEKRKVLDGWDKTEAEAKERNQDKKDTATFRLQRDSSERLDSGLKILKSVFKDQTNKIVDAITKANKDQLSALRSTNVGGNNSPFGNNGPSLPGKNALLKGGVAIASIAAGAYALDAGSENVSKVMDDKADTADRINAGAHLAVSGAGGVLGGLAGRAAGAVGLLDGGAAGGALQGAALGSAAGEGIANGANWLGRKIADHTDLYGALHDDKGNNVIGKAWDEAGDAIQGSTFAKGLGKSLAVVMSPFSADARSALKNDWNNNLMPAMDASLKPVVDASETIGSSVDQFKQSATTLGQGLLNAGSGLATGLGSAAKQFFSGNFKGAGETFSSTFKASARTVGTSAGQAMDIATGSARQLDLADGSKELRTGGTRSWRNNNEGNLRYGDFAKSHGAIGRDSEGFAIFADQKSGAKAKEDLLFGKDSKYKDLGVDAAIAKYAPPSENNTKLYQERVKAALGDSAGKKLADLTPDERTKMMDAMKQMEGYKEGKVSYKDASGNLIDKPTVLAKATSAAPTNLSKSSTNPAVVAKAGDVKASVVPTDSSTAIAVEDTTKSLTSKQVVAQASRPGNFATSTSAIPSAMATPAPTALLNPSTPPEVQPVMMTNAPKESKEQRVNLASNSQTVQSSVPQLDEIPMHITDFGLVLMQIGQL